MNLLVLGGTGFVGLAIQRAFAIGKAPEVSELLIASRRVDAAAGMQIDVSQPFSIPDRIDVVVHAATPASAFFNASQPLEMLRQISLGVENLVSAVRNRKGRRTRVVFLSSGAVFGKSPHQGTGWDEATIPAVDTLEKRNAYAIGKLYSEHLLFQASQAYDFELVVARLFTFSGSDLPLSRHFAIGNFVDDALTGRDIRVRGDGTAIRSYMDQADLARWILRACRLQDCPHPLHIGSEEAISIGDLAFEVADRARLCLGRTVNVIFEGRVSSLDGIDVYLPRTAKTRLLLGESQEVSLDASIDQMFEGDDRWKAMRT